MDLSEFKCIQCHACCKQDGHVRLLPHEVDIIADHLDMAIHEFTDQYTHLTQDRRGLSLIDKKNGECIFLTPEGCAINPVKPKQCRDFPHGWKFTAFKSICGWAKAHCKLSESEDT